ncbi:hypothetical protein AAFF_G00405850 [Aldrovandia affinis]|uniref:Uncharacterized protein n=1 Tax=Aldrovandia affinis TaxID=143900 RepID=A0AAD7WKB9_9TELE|nr:hypothetical protein AAFF_G00405850 [Aldrovandia affinis]
MDSRQNKVSSQRCRAVAPGSRADQVTAQNDTLSPTNLLQWRPVRPQEGTGPMFPTSPARPARSSTPHLLTARRCAATSVPVSSALSRWPSGPQRSATFHTPRRGPQMKRYLIAGPELHILNCCRINNRSTLEERSFSAALCTVSPLSFGRGAVTQRCVYTLLCG